MFVKLVRLMCVFLDFIQMLKAEKELILISILKKAKITLWTVNKNMYYVSDKSFSGFRNENMDAVRYHLPA